MKGVFVLYSGFSIFVVMNIITGFFVDAAVTTAQEDKKHWVIHSLCNAWADLDADRSGGIDRGEFKESLEKMAFYLTEIDLETHSLEELFDLFDVNGDGEITAEELLNGCVRISGNAKALDLAVVSHQVTLLRRQLQQLEYNLTGEPAGDVPR